MTTFTKEEMINMWPQAAGELTGFARHLHRTNAGLTAAQLEMAVQMSNAYLDIVRKEQQHANKKS